MAATSAIQFEGKTMQERGIKACAVFLERRGYEILERDWKCDAGKIDLIAKDDEDTVVFLEVHVYDVAEEGMPEDDVSLENRRRSEIIAGTYLAAADEVDIKVRFDIISLLVIGSDRALLRHHINVFNS